jgi:hypothetical protein
MATLQEVEGAFMRAHQAGDAKAAAALAQEVQRLRQTAEPAAEAAPAKAEQPSFGQMLKSEVANSLPGRAVRAVPDLVAGGVRGAGSIGATLLWPVDKITDMVQGDREQTLSTLVTGEKPISRNEERRRDMTGGLQAMGADTDSLAFGAGKLGGEIAGTAGVGGVLGNTLARIPGAATAMPGVINALRTGGMTTGQNVAPGAVNALRDLGTRAIGGAVTGGASAGLVDPEKAGAGAAVGGVLPVALKGAGLAGNALGRVLRGPEVPQSVLQGAQAAREAGLVIPPTQVKPSLSNRLLEGFSGKITTAQNASAKNQPVINDLIATELGLPAGQQVTPQALNSVREEAGKAYQALAQLPPREAVSGSTVMNQKAVAGFSPKRALQELRQARNDATAWYAAYARSASPDDQSKAKAAASIAAKLETQFEEYAKSLGREDLVPAMQEARKLIAKTYSAEKAMNPTTGNFDARKLADQLKKGKPLSGGLRTAGEFAQQFPKAAQAIEGMGSLPQTSPLDWAVGGSLSAATANPLAMAGVLARPAARALTLSPVVQNRLARQASQPNALAGLLSQSQLEQLGYQAAPVFAATGR